MGRWLNELRKLENASEANPQNPQNPSIGAATVAHGESERPAASEKIEKARQTEPPKPPKPPASAQRVAPSIPSNVVKGPWERQPGDMERYAQALREHGPLSYGMAMGVLGWGGTRAGQAESDLRAAGRIRFNELGRAVLIEEERP